MKLSKEKNQLRLLIMQDQDEPYVCDTTVVRTANPKKKMKEKESQREFYEVNYSIITYFKT